VARNRFGYQVILSNTNTNTNSNSNTY